MTGRRGFRSRAGLLAASLALVAMSGSARAGAVPVLVGGEVYSLALCESGYVWAWGGNVDGSLGNGSHVDSLLPVQVHVLEDIVALAGNHGEDHALALRRDGRVLAWGKNYMGQLGDGTYDDSPIPIEVPGLDGVVAVAVGEWTSVALRGDGTVWTWGGNDFGELGDGSHIYRRNRPVLVSSIGNIVAIQCGDNIVLALASDGTVWTWGYVYPSSFDSIPMPVAGLTGIVAIAGGFEFSLALRDDGTVWGWGRNPEGELGNGTKADSAVPVQVVGLTGVVSIRANDFAGYALVGDGSLWAWGSNAFGALGDGTRTDSSVPVRVTGLPSIAAIAVGDGHAFATADDSSVWAWGLSNSGDLGTGQLIPSYSLVPVRATNVDLLSLVPPDQGNVLRGVKRASGVSLDFTGAPASAWGVYRDPSKLALGTTALAPEVSVTGFLDPDAVVAAPALMFYRLKGLSPCPRTPGP